MNMPHEPSANDHYRAQVNHPPQRTHVTESVDPINQDMFARADAHPARATATDLAQRTSSQPPPQALSPASDIPNELAPRIKAAATRSGLRYESFTQQLLNCAFAHVKFWQQSDVERLFWLADRLGLDPLERDLIALEQKEPFPPSLGFMITLDGWVKLLHRHPRFRGLNFEEGPSDEHGLPLWVSCSLHWEGFACPWVVRE